MRIRMKSTEITREQLCGMFDHTNLKAYAKREDFEILCREARENHFAMVAINPAPVSLCKQLLEGSGVHVGAAISFPLGQETIEMKVAAAKQAILDGANEIDYVVNLGEIKNLNWNYIEREMSGMVTLCREENVISKVIFEICYLSEQEIVRLAQIAGKVLPDYIKTSTGFGTCGAIAETVRLMKQTAGEKVKVKAAGGIRDWASCAAMIDAGAERIGISSSLKILEEFDRYVSDGKKSSALGRL